MFEVLQLATEQILPWLSWQRILLTVLTIFVVYILNDFKQKLTYFGKMNIKGPMPLPIIGNMMLFLRMKLLQENLTKFNEKYGNIYGLFVMNQPTLMINDAEMAKEILVKQFQKFHGRRVETKMAEPYNSMITQMNGKRWKDLRSTLSPLFTAGKLRMMSVIFERAAKTFVGKLNVAAEEEKAINLMNYFRGYTMESIIASSFGLQSNVQLDPNDEIMLAAKKIMAPTGKDRLLALLPFLFGRLTKHVTRFRMQRLQEMTEKIIAQRRQQKDAEHINKDMLQLMLNAQHPDKVDQGLTNEEVLAQSILFLLAGYETSSLNLIGASYLLAKHQDKQEKLVEELKEKFGDSPDEIDPNLLHECQYLDAVVHEALRLITPVSIIARLAMEDSVVNGIKFKKGTSVAFPAFLMQVDNRYWKNPLEFQPERFLPENKGDLNPIAFMPFGHGPKNCIGMRFAMVKVKHVLIRMLLEFRIETCTETSPDLQRELMVPMTEKDGAMFRFFKRT